MKILVVDDNFETLELIRAFLQGDGHVVMPASRGDEALAALDKDKADLVMLDIRLPDTDGIEVLKAMRSKHPDVPVVMMTGFKEAELVVDAFRQGAIDCLLKPFNFEYLKQHILPRVKK
jgi:DNA-binding response OmpR family regulator